MNIDAVLNRKEVYHRVDDDMELLQELIELFLEDYPQLMSDIHSAIQNGDATALKSSAHTLKGSVSNFCAQSAVDAALKLEIAGGNEDLSTAEADFVALQTSMNEVSNALEELARDCVS